MNYLIFVPVVSLISVFGLGKNAYPIEGDNSFQKEVTRLTAFGKAYGYIRYFYPANLDRANWEKICIKGVKSFSKTTDTSSLASTLKDFFQPLAPLVSFDSTVRSNTSIIPERKTQFIYHEYLGLNTGDKYADFKNYLRTFSVDAGQIYPLKHFSLEVAPSVFINMPSVAPAIQSLPVEDIYKLTDPQVSNDIKTLWLCKAIITWNIIQHFYPYREDIGDWGNMLDNTISAILAANSDILCKAAYTQMIASLSDGHAAYIDKQSQNANYCLPLNLVMIDDTLLVRESMADSGLLQRGDEIYRINGVPISILKEKADVQNSGGDTFRKELFCLSIISGNKNDTARIDYRRKTENKYASLVYSLTPAQYNLISSKQVSDSMFFDNRSIGYFDLRKWQYKEIKKMIPIINKLKGVVFDLRGYPTENMDYLIQHLITFKDTAIHWMSIPLIKAPDFASASFKHEGWNLIPSNPHITTKTIFLSDARTYSFAESILGFIKDYKLGTVIGEASAGTNGDMNSILFGDNSSFTWSAVKVTTPTGMPYKTKGIQPDILVTKTRLSLVSGKDLPLEKALEEIRK